MLQSRGLTRVEIAYRGVVQVAWMLLLCLGPVRSASAQLVNYENDPVLAKAMERDSVLAKDKTLVSQALAEKHYLQYLQGAKNKDLRAKAYFQLGYIHSAGARRGTEDRRDLAKARRYYEMAIKEDPTGICQELLFARTQLASVTEAGDRRRARYVEVYRYLMSLNEGVIAKNIVLPVPPRELTPDVGGPDPKGVAAAAAQVSRQQATRRLVRLTSAVKTSTAHNMVSIASNSPVPEAELGKIVAMFPATDEIVQLAQKQLQRLAPPATQPAVEPRLTNAKRVFPKGGVRWKKPTQYSFWAMRLSPDGKSILYTRPKGEPPLTAEGVPDRHKAEYELLLRNLSTGKDTVLPIGPIRSGWRTGHTRFNPFDPTGRRLALAKVALVEVELDRPEGRGRDTAVRSEMEVLLYDVGAGKIKKTRIKGGMAFAKFDRTGKRLIAAQGSGRAWGLYTADLDKFKLKPIGVQGFPSGVCPGADVVCIWQPPKRIGRPTPRSRPKRGPQRLFLYDLKAGKEIANLRVHERNSKLDDWETQWTANGRYLYYYDVMEDPAATPADGRRKKTQPIVRIWDRVANKPAGTIGDAIPVGPGPTGTTMVLGKWGADRGGGIILHDAKTGVDWPLAGAGVHLVHAWGKRIAYMKRAADGTETAYVAEIVLTPADKKGR